jgi:hypothetical protein
MRHKVSKSNKPHFLTKSVSLRYVWTMLFSDDIYDPIILHESPQRPIYISIQMKSVFHLKCYLVTLGLKSMLNAFIGFDEQCDIMAFCPQ